MIRSIFLLLFLTEILSFNSNYYIRKLKLNKILDKMENNKIKKDIFKEIEYGNYRIHLEEKIKVTNKAFDNLKRKYK